MVTFDIITIFPKIFDSYFNESIISRGQKKKLIKINVHDLRKWTSDKRKTVDDKPYGGGPGMIFKVEPIWKALRALKTKKGQAKTKIILTDPAGKKFDQRMAEKLAKMKRVVILCGRYEGFDARVGDLVDEKISVGDYILTGGEIPAMAIVDVISRLVPGVVGKEESLREETFSRKDFVEYPQYTRPFEFRGWRVPKILLSGDHQKIKAWRAAKTGRK
jgi:tRNA (guanine37-N1)-methyltransferase